MKKLFALMLCLALALSLAACGNDPTPTTQPTTAPTTAPTTVPTTAPTTEPPLTVEQVYADVQQAMLNIEATRLRMELGFGVSYEEGEGEDAQTTEIGYEMLVDTIVSTDPFGSYATTSITFDTEISDMDITMDIYMVEEEGTVVTYMQAFDTWSRTDTEMTVDEFLTSGQMTEISTGDVWTGGEMPADMTLDAFTQSLDGTEVYILHCTLPVEGMEDALADMGVDLSDDTSEITMPVTYYVDAQNYTILRMDADMTALAELMSAAMAESLLGSDADASDVKMEMNTAVYELGYGPQEIPALPQEALDQATGNLPIADQATDMGDGSFVLPCGDETYLLTCPEGWTGEVYSENNVWFYNEDNSLYYDFYYWEGWSMEDPMNWVQDDVDTLKGEGIYLSHGDGPVCGEYKTQIVMGDGCSYYYAWISTGDGVFMGWLYDNTGINDPDTLLPQMLTHVSMASADAE